MKCKCTHVLTHGFKSWLLIGCVTLGTLLNQSAPEQWTIDSHTSSLPRVVRGWKEGKYRCRTWEPASWESAVMAGSLTGSLQPCKGLGSSFLSPALLYSKSGHWENLGSEPINRNVLYLSLFSVFQGGKKSLKDNYAKHSAICNWIHGYFQNCILNYELEQKCGWVTLLENKTSLCKCFFTFENLRERT